MKTENLQEVLAWLKTTDLVEVQYKAEGEGFSLATAEAPALPNYPIPQSRFQPVTAPAVGIFQFSALGKARKAEEGVDVAEGETLGLVEVAKGKTAPVTAPCAGRVAKVFVEGAGPVEYGQVLLFVEPR